MEPHRDTEQEDAPKPWAIVVAVLCVLLMFLAGLGFIGWLVVAGG